MLSWYARSVFSHHHVRNLMGWIHFWILVGSFQALKSALGVFLTYAILILKVVLGGYSNIWAGFGVAEDGLVSKKDLKCWIQSERWRILTRMNTMEKPLLTRKGQKRRMFLLAGRGAFSLKGYHEMDIFTIGGRRGEGRRTFSLWRG